MDIESRIRKETNRRIRWMIPRVEKRTSVLECRLVTQIYSLLCIIEELRDVNGELREELWKVQSLVNNNNNKIN